ncbi:MAG: hypothetical protein DME72_08500 [Verrucomicrobia bacterium]|nr:MAG: hypothetical protein DME72_08500 [Verrucomicrobiota bacterium]
MNNTAIILNPTAGSKQAEGWRERIESIAHGCTLFTTSRSGEAEAMARHAVEKGFKKIAAAGGDGTINEVVNGLAGSNAALGLLPLGTANVFAICRSSEREWEILRPARRGRARCASREGNEPRLQTQPGSP